MNATAAPTARQLEFLRDLVADLIDARKACGEPLEITDPDALIASIGGNPEAWTRGTVSALIDTVRERIATARSKATAAGAAPARSNRYAGPCIRCGGTVEAGAGALIDEGGRWKVAHVGPCPEGPEGGPAPVALPDVPAGHYAVPTADGGPLAFYRVDRPASGAYAGRTYVKRVVGGRPDARVPYAQVPAILVAIAADADAGPRYGREIGRCCRCNRHLTDEVSRAAGMGPECRKR